MIGSSPVDMFRPGQVLNNTYEIERLLGAGGTSEVYRASNQITGRVVAIKAVKREFAGSAGYVDLMRREEEMRAISHDAVVRYTDCNRTEDGHVYLVMDYVDGTPLSDWLERGRVDPRDLMTVARRVCEGLVATHAKRIVHRDLSPDNIMLRGGRPEEAVIIDFGIAKDARVGARTVIGNAFAGKVEYAAPEQLHGQAEPRSDLYALGTSLLATFRGQTPDVGSSPGEVMRRKQLPLDTSGVPEPLKTLIEDLTDPDPSRRPPDATAALATIDRLTKAGSNVSKPQPQAPAGRRPAGPSRPTAPPPARSPWPAIAILAAILLPAIGLGALWATGNFPFAAREERPLVLGTGTGTESSDESGDEGVAAGGDKASTPATDQAGQTETDDVGTPAVPPPLTQEALARALAPVSTCGPLRAAPPPGGTYAPSDGVAVTGYAAAPADLDRIRAALAVAANGRPVRIDVKVLDGNLCDIVGVLPPVSAGPIAIVLRKGDDPEPNPTGIYAPGDVPVIDVLLPADDDSGHLWVAVADVDGNLYNILPNSGLPENRVTALGTVSDGMRTVRVAHSRTEQTADPKKLSFTIDETFGKTLVLVLRTDKPLFDQLRPTTETIKTFSADLRTTLESRPANVRSITSRVIDSPG